MKVTVVVSVRGKTDLYMSRSDAFPGPDDMDDDELLRELVSAMAVGALDNVLKSIDEDLKK
jgi:hypothetical protein